LGAILTVHGWLVGRLDYIASGVLIIVIGITVGVATMRTSYTVITKRYFAAEALVGKTGKAEASFKAQAKGAVHIEHETWSAVSEEDISLGDHVVVTAVDSDRATLRVRKQNP
jgi:membrane protein implicated in regulation of membrane protease activity